MADYEPVEIVIGMPRTLKGERGSSAKMAEAFARLVEAGKVRVLGASAFKAEGLEQVIASDATLAVVALALALVLFPVVQRILRKRKKAAESRA